MTPFLSGAGHLEEMIYSYKDAIESGQPTQSFADTLWKTASTFTRHMVMIIITDAEGLAQMTPGLIRRLTYYNDVYIFKIEDAMLTSENTFDLEDSRYTDPFLSICGDLRQQETQIREHMEQAAIRDLTPNRIFFNNISREEEIVDALIWLFARRKGTI